MKKIFLLVFLCFFIATSAFASILSDSYAKGTLAVFCVDYKELKAFGEVDKNKTEASKAFIAIEKIIEKRFSININESVKQLGFFVARGPVDFQSFLFINGKFDMKKIGAVVKQLTAKTNGEESAVKLESMPFNGKKIPLVSYDNFKMLFLNPTTVICCNKKAFDYIKQNRLSFGSAPKEVVELSKRSPSFAFVDLAIAGNLEAPNSAGLPLGMIKNFNSISAFLKDSFLHLEADCKDQAFAKETYDQLDSLIKMKLSTLDSEIELGKTKVAEAPVKDVFEAMSSVFAAARTKDFINDLKLTSSGNKIFLKSAFDIKTFAIGIVGIAAAMAVPNFKAARDTARLKACYSNQRVLLGAVEMYNMDAEPKKMMTNLDIKELVRQSYLRSEPEGSDSECEYYSDGNLAENGKIYCKKHGSFEEAMERGR